MLSVALVPALSLLGGVYAGIAWARPRPWGLLVLAALWLAACAAWRRRHDAAVLAATMTGFLVAGGLLGGAAASLALESPLRRLLDREVGGFALTALGPPTPHDPIRMRARLLEDAVPGDGLASVRVAVERLAPGGRGYVVSGGVRLSVGGDAIAARAPELRAGRTIEVPVTFRRPARYLNDGVADAERDLALDGITLLASAKSALLVRVVAPGSVAAERAADVRAHVRSSIGRWIGSRDPIAGGIVTAILIGDRTGLPPDVRARLQAAGTYHVIAISGGNIAILAGLVAGLLIAGGIGGRTSAAIVIACLVGYAAIVAAGPSVWRATAMAVVYLAARLIDHRSPPWNAMAVSAAVLATVAPLDVRDVGFALTFGATGAILEAARLARASRRSRWLSWMLASVTASLAAEIVLLPIAASAFSRVTAAGLLLNLLAVPLMTVAQVAGLVVVASDGVPAIASAAGLAGSAAAAGLVESARLVDALPWLAIRVPPPAPAVVAAYYVALGTALWLRRARTFSGCVALAMAAVMLAGAVPSARLPAPRDRLRLTVFDVGQGDALLLQAPPAGTLLVDTGGAGFDGAAFDIGGRVLAPALWARGLRRLDALAITHPDPDHVGGALAVLRDFAPSAIWQGIPVATHPPWQALTAAAATGGRRVDARIAGEQFLLGRASIRVLHPPPPDWERPRVRNDDSLVLEVRYGDVALLLTGDVGADVERALVSRLSPAPIRILKVAHHGSRTSTSAELLNAWQPQVALISCGRGNRFGHPAPAVLARLAAAGVRVYRTDRDGQITVTTDGERVEVRTYMGGGL